MIAYTAAAQISVIHLGGSFSAPRGYGYSPIEVKRGIHT